MTQLSHLSHLGIAKETVPGTYVAPTAWIPFTKADFDDMVTYLKDESYRANDTALQGLYQGPIVADWSIDVMAYPDIAGHFLRGIIGPDVVTAGVATTLSAPAAAAATSLSVAATIPTGSYVRIDTAGLVEYAKVTAVSGSGPFTLTVTTSDSGPVGLVRAHSSGVAVVAATTHTFRQTSLPADKATYSLTIFDTVDTRGYSDFVLSDLSIKIDPKGVVTLAVKGKAMPGVPQTLAVPSYGVLTPHLGWEWVMTNAGAASNRGLSLDVALKRTVDVVNSSDGTQGPREIFQGAMDASGNYKAIFENHLDLDLYERNIQGVTQAVCQQPAALGGSSLTLLMSKGGWSKGKRDLGGNYVQASYSVDGIYNAADGGAITAVLTNWQSAAY